MDKNAIKKFAISARQELIDRVRTRAQRYGIEDKKPMDPYAVSVGGHVLSSEEQQQRKNLIERIKASSYELVMEEAAYTWFNRFCALRYMEVNGYLPSRVRVFTNEENEFEPQILKEAINLDLPGLEMERVYAYKDADQNEELYRYLLITQCNALSKVLPGMFRRLADFTELLLPDNLLRESSVIHSLVTEIPQEDWQDQVQIIGWLYQYYNTEPKDKVFADLKKNIKITKEKIPAATQLFTPDWIVRYMVENSLGRLWVEGHPDADLQAQWKYYLEEAPQEPQVQAQLSEIRRDYAKLTPEDIKVIDPCMGSGHILAYMFDVLLQIYRSTGYSERDAVASIVKNNLFGLDIDDRAAQLAYFSVMMKARQYDRRFFSRNIQPRVYAIQESNTISRSSLKFFGTGLPKKEREKAQTQLLGLLDTLHDAKEYGSILNIPPCDWPLLRSFLTLEDENFQLDMEAVNLHETHSRLLELVEIAETMAQKYHAVVTNPPYMGGSGMSAKLGDFVKKNYPDSKSDLFAVFIERCGAMTVKNGFQAMITQHAWMFLSSYEKLRSKLQAKDTVNMAHLGARAFEEIGGEVVQTTSFVMTNRHAPGYKGTYCRLIDPTTQQGKEDMFLARKNNYITKQESFDGIPGGPIAYWVNNSLIREFSRNTIEKHYAASVGLQTSNNDLFLKMWYEVASDSIEFNRQSNRQYHKKWYPHPKGGGYRRWYGNLEYVINWQYNGREINKYNNANYNVDKYGVDGVCWSHTSTAPFAGRIYDKNSIPNLENPVLFTGETDRSFLLAYLNTKVVNYCIRLLNTGLHFHVSNVLNLPLPQQMEKNIIEKLSNSNIELSKTDWDSFETSWDFTRHPLVGSGQNRVGSGQWFVGSSTNTPNNTTHSTLLADHFSRWEQECATRFSQLKSNEEALNRIFIDIYGLQDELTPEVEDKDVTVRKADLQRDIRSLISYAVGCMFGRYSLDVPGLAYAGGDWDSSKYQTFLPDEDNIIPICDDDYFTDDIVSRFVDFVRTVYGEETLEENLRFIADALGGKGQPREVIRNYFLNDFYADHLKIYQKRPIYWLFDSGKKNGFKALIYMHRYRPDTVARIRTDYVHEQQSRYRTAAEDLSRRLNDAVGSERARLSKQLAKLTAQSEELRTYEEKIHHLADRMLPIDLDDGVKVNYAKFEDVLAKIK